MAKSAFAKLKVEEEPPPPPAVQPSRTQQGERQASRLGKKTIIFYDEPKVWQALRNLSTDEFTTMQALLHEAVDLLLKSRGKVPFGKR